MTFAVYPAALSAGLNACLELALSEKHRDHGSSVIIVLTIALIHLFAAGHCLLLSYVHRS